MNSKRSIPARFVYSPSQQKSQTVNPYLRQRCASHRDSSGLGLDKICISHLETLSPPQGLSRLPVGTLLRTFRARIAQRRVEPTLVVVPFEKFLYLLPQA